ncbi:hypothetical protein TrLO_g2976 [Triparma laevis f. longispina]|uniref:Uncharacterized protein n=1 Tax=Triparma laevis f. longispina TaxID=1714387 RepID=A0A9W7E248_9STRA|nr:hypothetical protein TrLO_g2976 [Triparma laevis f. longispina]
MTIPDSLQTLSPDVFYNCSKLFPSNIIVSDLDNDTTSEVVAHLRSKISLNALLSGNNFLNTDDFYKLIVSYLPNDALMTIKLSSKPWSRVADEFISDDVESGAMIVHDRNDIEVGRDKNDEYWEAFEFRRKLVTRVIFLLNITKVGDRACTFSANLVVVDISEGVERIGDHVFYVCSSLSTMSFPTTLKSFGECAFVSCRSLDNVDLLHTNLQGLGHQAFWGCSELKSMTMPDSLQTFGNWVFVHSSKLVPSNINVCNNNAVVAYLRFQQ